MDTPLPPRPAGQSSPIAPVAAAGPHARGSRGRFVPLTQGAAPGDGPRVTRATIEARKAEYAVFLRVFLLRSEIRDDWVPYAQCAAAPLTKLYEVAVDSKFRVGAGSRAGLARRFHFGTDAGAVKTGLPRRNVVDPVNGTRARTRLFMERRLPRSDSTAEMLTIRTWLQSLAQRSMLRPCWKSIPDCLAALTMILGSYRQGVHGWGYVGYPSVADARNGGKGGGDGEGDGDDAVDDGAGKINENDGVQSGSSGSDGGRSYLSSALKEVNDSFTVLLANAGGGRADVRIDDAVRELRCVLERAGAQGDIGDDDSLADALEEACGKDAFRVNSFAFRIAFHSVITRQKLVLPMELPKEFGECFLAAATPSAELGCRQAARVLVKVWNDIRSTPVAVQLFHQRAASGKSTMDRELDVADVRALLRGFCSEESDQLEVSIFEKAARQILFDGW